MSIFFFPLAIVEKFQAHAHQQVNNVYLEVQNGRAGRVGVGDGAQELPVRQIPHGDLIKKKKQEAGNVTSKRNLTFKKIF